MVGGTLIFSLVHLLRLMDADAKEIDEESLPKLLIFIFMFGLWLSCLFRDYMYFSDADSLSAANLIFSTNITYLELVFRTYFCYQIAGIFILCSFKKYQKCEV